MKLIDKDALVAEIERRIKEIDEIGTYLSPRGTLTNLLYHLNTLEAKEVDLDKLLTGFMSRYAYENGGEYPSAIEIAKHFFELGMSVNNKAQKGE